MAKLTTRAFVALRMDELKVFFERYYGDGYVAKLSKSLGIMETTLREFFSIRSAAGGRPAHTVALRLKHASDMEKHARALGWRSGLNVKVLKSYKALVDDELLDVSTDLAFSKGAGEARVPPPPFAAVAPSPDLGFPT